MKPYSHPKRYLLLAGAVALATVCIGRDASSFIQPADLQKTTTAASLYTVDDALTLRGKGRLTYLFWKVYDVELHLPQAVPSTSVFDEHPRSISFTYLRAFSAEDLRTATSKTVAERRGNTPAAEITEGLVSINALWPAVRAGDCLKLYYKPTIGTTVFINDRPLGVVKGAAFARVLFSVWLGEKPIDGELRTALLKL